MINRRLRPRYIALGFLAVVVTFLYAVTAVAFLQFARTDAAVGDTASALALRVVPVVLFPLAAGVVGLIVYLRTRQDLFRAALATLLAGLALEVVAVFWVAAGSVL